MYNYLHPSFFFFFFFNDTATTEIYTLSLHDALPISTQPEFRVLSEFTLQLEGADYTPDLDRKSTRLNSSHLVISYAVFCLKKKKQITQQTHHVLNTPDNRYYALTSIAHVLVLHWYYH